MFVKVRFEIENRSADMLTFAGLELQDAQGREYTRSSDAYFAIPDRESCVLENLNPNIVQTCTAIYEVPADATGLMAVLGDLKLFGGKEAKVDLGQ